MVFGKNPLTRQKLDDGARLHIVKGSPFLTIQGEGPNVGRPAVFLRLHGCNLACTFCDTNFSDPEDPIVPIESLADQIGEFKKGLCVITGGEPLIQNILPLVRVLKNWFDMEVQIETAGTVWIENIEKYTDIVCSPKTPTIHPMVFKYADAFKYLISAGNEHEHYLPVMATQRGTKPRALAAPRADAPVYLSPLDEYDDEKNARNCALVSELAIRYDCIAGCQLHKVLSIKEPA